MRPIALWGFFALSLAAVPVAGAQDQQPGMGELPPPASDLLIFPGKPATRPFEAVSGQAAATRVLFEGAGPDNTQIIIREMLIGPGADVRLDALPGSALIDPRSGSGTLRAGERREQLQIATAVSVEPGVPIQLINDGDDSLLLRLYIVETR
jgi:hypothetical protein